MAKTSTTDFSSAQANNRGNVEDMFRYVILPEDKMKQVLDLMQSRGHRIMIGTAKENSDKWFVRFSPDSAVEGRLAQDGHVVLSIQAAKNLLGEDRLTFQI